MIRTGVNYLTACLLNKPPTVFFFNKSGNLNAAAIHLVVASSSYNFLPSACAFAVCAHPKIHVGRKQEVRKVRRPDG